VARSLCRAAERPLTATSANVSGAPPTSDPDAVAKTIGDRIDVLLDGGPTAGGLPSTIVDFTGSEPKLVRAGAIAWADVLACLQRA
jgi:L-threonylcarbamoyladenylate synthase